MSSAFQQLEIEAERSLKDLGIPPCPAILGKIMRETAAVEPDFKLIGQWISADVSLAAAMLKTVNSPFYGLQRKAETVHQALMFLGLRTVSLIVTGLLLRQAFSGARNPGLVEFWDRSSHAAAASARVAAELRVVDRDLAYTFALFRDCGVPVLAAKHPGYDTQRNGASTTDAHAMLALEAEWYGVHHAQVGAELARSWGLGEEMCNAIASHHAYPADPQTRVGAPRGSQRLVAIEERKFSGRLHAAMARGAMLREQWTNVAVELGRGFRGRRSIDRSGNRGHEDKHGRPNGAKVHGRKSRPTPRSSTSPTPRCRRAAASAGTPVRSCTCWRRTSVKVQRGSRGTKGTRGPLVLPWQEGSTAKARRRPAAGTDARG